MNATTQNSPTLEPLSDTAGSLLQTIVQQGKSLMQDTAATGREVAELSSRGLIEYQVGEGTTYLPTPAGRQAAALRRLQQLSPEQLAQAYAHLQAWVLQHRQDLPPLSRLGAMAGLTRAQATTLLTGKGNRTAKTAQRLSTLQAMLQKHAYNPYPFTDAVS